MGLIRTTSVAVTVAFLGCTVDLEVPQRARIPCGEETACPPSLRCNTSVGRCVAPDAPATRLLTPAVDLQACVVPVEGSNDYLCAGALEDARASVGLLPCLALAVATADEATDVRGVPLRWPADGETPWRLVPTASPLDLEVEAGVAVTLRLFLLGPGPGAEEACAALDPGGACETGGCVLALARSEATADKDGNVLVEYGAGGAACGVACRDGCEPSSGSCERLCFDEGHPPTELCDGLDNDCDGRTDEECVCAEGERSPCLAAEGECPTGTRTCQGERWSECLGGQVLACPAGLLCAGGQCAPCALPDDGACGAAFGPGFSCGADGRCALERCANGAQCYPSGQVCRGERCAPCRDEEDCLSATSGQYPAGTRCSAGTCLSSGCGGDDDCPEELPICGDDERCRACAEPMECQVRSGVAETMCDEESGRCVSGDCHPPLAACGDDGSRICGADFSCRDCARNSECAGAMGDAFLCVAGRCVDAECNDERQCPAGRSCEGNRCIECSGHADCSGGARICDGNVCRDCVDGGECGSGRLCVDGVCLEADCWIDGRAWRAGEEEPGAECSVCDPANHRFGWWPSSGTACNDGVFCNGPDRCVEGACTEHPGDPCTDDGLWCNGDDWCDEEAGRCLHSETPASRCPDDEQWCNGAEHCDDEGDGCTHELTPPERCPDDGVFCNGEESCDEGRDECVHSGDPCRLGGVCEEGAGWCVTICEEVANTHTDDGQQDPVVALDGTGNAVVVWRSQGQDGDGVGVFGQRFRRDGLRLGQEFQVNTFSEGWQTQPAVAMAPSGAFVVVWISEGIDGDDWGIVAQRFGVDGAPQGAERQVNTYWLNQQTWPDVAMDGAGGFVVVWQSDGEDHGVAGQGAGGIFGQRFGADGEPAGAPFRANETVEGHQTLPAVAAATDGSFAVVWESVGQDGSGNGVYGRWFDAAGDSPGGEVRVNVHTAGDQNLPDVAALGDGGFVAVWRSAGQDLDGDGVYARLFDAAGQAPSGEVLVPRNQYGDQGAPRVAAGGEHGFVVTFLDRQAPGSGDTLWARWFDASGAAAAIPLPVSDWRAARPWFGNVAMAPSGDVVVAWSAEGADGSELGVLTRRFPGRTGPACGWWPVNRLTWDNQRRPAAAALGAAGWAVVWETEAVDDRSSVFAQVFGADGEPEGSNVALLAPDGAERHGPALAGRGADEIVLAAVGDDGDGSGVFVGVYDLTGERRGAERRANEHTAGGQSGPAVASDGASRHVVVWTSAGQDGSGLGVFARLFGADGAPLGGEVPVNTTTDRDQGAPSVGMVGDGSFVVAWDSDGQDGDERGVFARRFDAAGHPDGAEIPVNEYPAGWQHAPSVAVAPGGAFVVAWIGQGQDVDNAIWAQRFDGDGSRVGDTWRVDTPVESVHSQSEVALSPDGADRFVAVWQSSHPDQWGWEVLARRYDAAGQPVGDGQRVNVHYFGRQDRPSVAALPGGAYLVAWQSDGHDCSDDGVYAQAFAADGSRVSCE